MHSYSHIFIKPLTCASDFTYTHLSSDWAMSFDKLKIALSCIKFMHLTSVALLFFTICISARIVPVCLISYYERWLVLIRVAACELWWSSWCFIRLIVWVQPVSNLGWSFHFPLFSFSSLFFLVFSCEYLGLWIYGWSILNSNLGYAEPHGLWSPLVVLWFGKYLLVVDI